MSYTPSVMVHPGRIIARELDFLGMTQKMLSERTGLSEKQLSLIINGSASITADTAALLSNAIGGSAMYWSNLDSSYRALKAQQQMRKRAEREVGLVQTENFTLAYTELVGHGYMTKVKDPITRVLSFWCFFGVNSLNAIETTEATAFRKGNGKKYNPIALAAWIRCGEREATKRRISEYDSKRLQQALPEIRRITATSVQDDPLGGVTEILAECGVIVVLLPHFKGTYVNGATKWLGNNPIIQVSIRGKNADRLWFTLFHEIGHILKHSKQGYVSCDGDNSAQEQEANDFAAESLLPRKDYDTFRYGGDYSRSAILDFANKLQVDPGVILGRLQHDGLVPFRCMNDLHKKLCWKPQ